MALITRRKHHKSPFPKYVQHFRDRYGKTRTYFRRGSIQIPLPEPILGPAWLKVYRAAFAAHVLGNEADPSLAGELLMPRPAGLRVIRRHDTGAFQITGTVAGQRIRRRAESSDRALAREEAHAIEAQLLRAKWYHEHGDPPRQVKQPNDPLNLTIHDIRQLPTDHCGVYFLFQKLKIQYVGQSQNIVKRIIEHRKAKIIPFDDYRILPCEPGQLLLIEAFYITKFQPPYNRELHRIINRMSTAPDETRSAFDSAGLR